MRTGPETAPSKRRPWGRRFAAFLLLAIRHSSSWILRIFFTLLLLLILLFAYLHLVGFPAYFTDRFLDRMAGRGYFLQIERLTLEIDRGLVARNVRLFAAADAPEPFMEAEALTVAVNPVPLVLGTPVTPVLSIVDGSLRAHLGRGRFGARQGSRAIAVDRIHLRFSASEQEILLREFSADFLNVHFRGRGSVFLSPTTAAIAPSEAVPARLPGNPLASAIHAIENAPAWVLQVVEQANEIAFDETPTADFAFTAHLARPQANAASFRLDNPAGGRMRGVAFDRSIVDVALKDQQIHLPDLQIHKGNGILSLSGWFDTTNRMVSAHLLNTLPPDTFLELLPDDVQAKAAEVVADYRFPLRLELQIGPAPLETAAEQFVGRLSFSKANVREVPIDSLDAHFSRKGPEFRLEKASIQLDTGARASRLKIQDGSYHLVNSQFQARVSGTLDPHVLKPLMTPNMRKIVEWFGVPEPLAADVVLGGVAGNPAIYCYGPVQTTNLAINQVATRTLQGNLNVTNEVLHITGAILTRPEGIARGDVHMAFSNQTLRLENVDSTLDPRAIAQMIGPEVAEFMEPFHLNVPTRLRADGVLDYCNFSLNQLEVHVEAQRFGYDRWETDAATFDLTVLGRRLRFTNVAATAYGGQFAGAAALYPVASDARWRYEVDFAATNVNLTNLLFASTGDATEKLAGDLDGAAWIGGYVGKGTGTNVAGAGHAKIRNGKLYETKLFFGFLEILTNAVPNFAIVQTDAQGDFTIRDGKLRSRNVELLGTVFSVMASGDYSFAGNLDFRVEVQLLRSGPVATLVRLATRPVTRLLELHLTGTFAEPRWRPVNPATLFSAEK